MKGKKMIKEPKHQKGKEEAAWMDAGKKPMKAPAKPMKKKTKK